MFLCKECVPFSSIWFHLGKDPFLFLLSPYPNLCFNLCPGLLPNYADKIKISYSMYGSCLGNSRLRETVILMTTLIIVGTAIVPALLILIVPLEALIL